MKSSGAVIASLVLAVSSTALADPPPAATPSPPPAAGPMPPHAVQGPRFDPKQPVPLKTHSPALMGGGIALTGVGVVSTVGGVTAIVADLVNRNEYKGLLAVLIGVPLLVHGLGCIAGGIPMIAIGAKKIPVTVSKSTPQPAPVVMVTPRSASIQLSF